MGNFDFLLEDKDYKSFAQACIAAEKASVISTTAVAILTRRALELAVKWIYEFDYALSMPYRDNLSTLINHSDFKDILDSRLHPLIVYTVKLGNKAVHTSKTIKQEESNLTLKNLFKFIQWLDYSYGENYKERHFDESLLMTPERLRETPETVERLLKKEKATNVPLEELRQQHSADLRQTFSEKREKYQSDSTRHLRLDDLTEKETRELIDFYLQLAGWEIGENATTEEAVKNMPNKTKTGYVDYVLWWTGKPIAVVEAKRAKKDPHEGRKQALIYADLLEKAYGVKPFVFYTNGFEIWFVEGQLSERRVSGFFRPDELVLKLERQRDRRPLQVANLINDEITNRPYQKEAILRTCEAFTNNHRHALLVMATGTGKTRVSISLVDVLRKSNWVKNVLFLADRTALVNQAYSNFKNLLPDLSLMKLSEVGKNKASEVDSSRMIFSTYQTMISKIDSMKSEDGRLVFSPGHFDLIIIDESHRSIYQKFGAIFDYFDALLVGLTATPRDDLDKNTYERFHLENGVPTYAYDLDDAIKDGYLVDLSVVDSRLKLPTDGIHYDDLSEEEKDEFDDTFGDEVEEVKDIDGSAINEWLFNVDTIDKVVKHVMEKGIRDASGDEIGKTIIFAKNHRHAQKIKERFDFLYPEKGGEYTEVIDYSVNYYQQLIDDFSVKDKFPRVAISVDMLDTGIDIPEVVNLVFFKKVRSKVKFWQMIGRGTRLCSDLFGPGLDKKGFQVFDYGANFEFFNIHKRGKESKLTYPLSQRIFKQKVNLIRGLQDLKYQSRDFYVNYRKELVDEMCQLLSSLDLNSFRVKAERRKVLEYQSISGWEVLTETDIKDIKDHLSQFAKLDEKDEAANRFDLSMLTIENGVIIGKIPKDTVKAVMETASELSKHGTIPQIRENAELIMAIQKPDYWVGITVENSETIRRTLRDLIKVIPEKERKFYYTNFEDELTTISEDIHPILEINDLRSYRQKVEHYLKEHADDLAVYKLRHNKPLTKLDLQKLEKVLWEELGSQEQYEKEYGNKTISRLVREIVGMEKSEVEKEFSGFISKYYLNADQLTFVNLIIDYVSKNGYLEKQYLLEDPFKSVGSITKLFSDKTQQQKLLDIIEEINRSVDAG